MVQGSMQRVAASGPRSGVNSPLVPDLARIAAYPDAFEAFYREHLVAVKRFVARRVDDPHLAADLTAEVFLAAIDSASSYRPDRGAPAAWLVGVARHVLAKELHRQTRERRIADRVSGQRLLDPDSFARIEEQIDAEREARKLYSALAALPLRERELMVGVALDGPTVTAAAAVGGVPPGAARVRLPRGRARLHKHVKLPDRARMTGAELAPALRTSHSSDPPPHSLEPRSGLPVDIERSHVSACFERATTTTCRGGFAPTGTRKTGRSLVTSKSAETGLRLPAGSLSRECPMVKRHASTSGRTVERSRCRWC